MSIDVAIVGGGISGLAAAYELNQRRISFRVFEATNVPGGVIKTDRFDGWTVDGGPDSMLVQKPAAVALCRELGIADRLVSTLTPRTAYVLRSGRLHPIVEGSFLGFPLSVGALARSSLFSPAGKIRMACEVALPRREDEVDDEAIGDFVRRRFGQEATDYLAEPLLAGIHAGDVDRLSTRALFPRLMQAEREHGSVIRAFRAMHTKPSPQGAFVSLPGGVGELIDALAQALPPGSVATGTPVTSLEQTTTGFTLTTATESITARAVVLAVPAYAAASLLRAIDAPLAALCDEMPYASTATVALGYRRANVAHPLRGTGFVVPRVEPNALLAATWVTSKWPGRAPDGNVLLRGFLGGGRDPQRLDLADDALVEIVRSELGALLGIDGDPIFTRLYRWTRRSPQFEVGHLARLDTIERRLAALRGLFVTGSGFRAIGIPDCIADGRAVASRAATLASASLS